MLFWLTSQVLEPRRPHHVQEAHGLPITLHLSKAVHIFIYMGTNSKAILNPVFGFLAIRRQDIKPRESLSEPPFITRKKSKHIWIHLLTNHTSFCFFPPLLLLLLFLFPAILLPCSLLVNILSLPCSPTATSLLPLTRPQTPQPLTCSLQGQVKGILCLLPPLGTATAPASAHR